MLSSRVKGALKRKSPVLTPFPPVRSFACGKRLFLKRKFSWLNPLPWGSSAVICAGVRNAMQSGLVSRRLLAGHGVALPAGVALTYPILPSRKLCRGTVRELFCCDLSRRRSKSKKKKSRSLPLRTAGPPSPKFGIGNGPPKRRAHWGRRRDALSLALVV